MGTVDYVAPEQIQGGEVDGRADEYSLACVLYQCLTGVVPFDKGTDVATLFGHLQDPPPRISARRPEVAPALDEAVARGMAKEPNDRHPTCTAMIDAAARAIGMPLPSGEHDQTVVAEPLLPLPPDPADGPGSQPQDTEPKEIAPKDGGPEPGGDEEEKGSRRRTLIAVAAVVGVLAIAGAAFALLGGGDDARDGGGGRAGIRCSNTASAIRHPGLGPGRALPVPDRGRGALRFDLGPERHAPRLHAHGPRRTSGSCWSGRRANGRRC